MSPDFLGSMAKASFIQRYIMYIVYSTSYIGVIYIHVLWYFDLWHNIPIYFYQCWKVAKMRFYINVCTSMYESSPSCSPERGSGPLTLSMARWPFNPAGMQRWRQLQTENRKLPDLVWNVGVIYALCYLLLSKMQLFWSIVMLYGIF